MSERIKNINNNVLELIKIAKTIRGQNNSDEYYSERILLKQVESLTTHQAPKLHPDVEQCLKFDTISTIQKHLHQLKQQQ